MAINDAKRLTDPLAFMSSKKGGRQGQTINYGSGSESNFFAMTTYRVDREFEREKTRTVTGGVTLPLPVSGMVDNQAISYDQANLGVLLGSLGASTVQAVGSAVEAATKQNGVLAGYGAAVSSLAGSIKNQVERAQATAKAMSTADVAAAINAGAGNLLGEGAQTLVASQLRQAPNPHVTAVFRGVPLKEFNFTFHLMPGSRFESEQIKSLVYFLKGRALPERSSAGLTLRYPDEVDIGIVTGSQETGAGFNTITFKPAFLSNITVNYNQEGNAFFYDGNPVGVMLNLQFIETDYHRADDYDAATAQMNAIMST